MEDQDAIIEIRLTGNGVNPQSLKAKEVAELLKGLEDSLFHIVSTANPDISRDEIYISLTDVKDESLGLAFMPNLKSITVAGFVALTTAISTGTLEQLPIKSIEGLRDLIKVGKRKNCNTEFKLNREVRAVWLPTASVEIPSSAYITGFTTIYPYIKRSGGTTPTVAMRIDANDPYIYVTTTEEFAKKLGERLYTTVGLTGTATWERVTRRLIDFKIEQILNYRETASVNTFDVLQNTLGSYWDAIEDLDAYLMEEDD